jgi:hypothetical protein
MASINTRASLVVQVDASNNAQGNTDNISSAGTPLTVLCNRDYRVVDWAFVTNVISGQNDGAVLIESVTSLGATTLGNVDASADSGSTTNILRPTTVTLGQGTTNALIQAANVSRGNTLRVRSIAAAGDLGANIRCSGIITILPGNRYAAGAGTYYPNNSTALQA